MQQPEVLAGARLHHVALQTPDLDAAQRFYRRLGFQPGFEKRDQNDTPILLQMHLGDIVIELLAGAAASPLARPEQGHFALHVPSAALTHAGLTALGLLPDAPCQRGASGVSYFFLRDPAGHWIEFISP